MDRLKSSAKSALYLVKRTGSRLLGYKPICNEFPLAHIIVLSDGTVTTCCADAFGKNVFSSVYDHSIETVWKDHVRQVLDSGLFDLELCRTCPMVRLVRAGSEEYQAWLNRTDDYPDNITIEVMGACNYGCCAAREVHQYREVKPDLSRIFSALEPYLPFINRLRLFNYGEPLLHDGFMDFIARCRRAAEGLKMIVSTNGLLLDKFSGPLIENRVDQLLVSIHGGPGTENMLKYSGYGADYERVIDNVRAFLKERQALEASLPKLSLRVILFNWNDSDADMNRIRSLAGSLGLEASDGDPETDNYHWILNSMGTGDLSSSRFRPGSAALERLIEAGEFFAG